MNESGIVPVDTKILIKPEEIEERTEGGIILPQQAKEKDQWAQQKGILIALGGTAFESWKGRLPVVGETVYYTKYAGCGVDGNDGAKYRICQDEDIAAIIE